MATWEVERTSQFDADYTNYIGTAIRLKQFRESWEFYLPRDPITHTVGLVDPDDDSCRLLSYGDELAGLEVFVGVSLDRKRQIVWLRWLDTCEMQLPE